MAEHGFLVEVSGEFEKSPDYRSSFEEKNYSHRCLVLLLEYRRPIVVKNWGSRMVANRPS